MRDSEPDFVHLHVHTEYSLLEAACRLEDLVRTAKAWEMPAIAMTDKGAVHGAMRFTEFAERHGIHPIIGCEMKDGDTEGTLIVLAATKEGFRLIVEHLNDGTFLPPVSNGDIIVLSGGRSGAIHRLLASGRTEQAEKLALEYRNRFGKDNFYLEVQHHGFPEDDIVMERTVQLARVTGISLVATHDVHYLAPEDAELLDLLQYGRTKQRTVPQQTAGGPYYLPSPDEMKQKFGHLPDALDNTVRIARRIRFRPEPEKAAVETSENRDEALLRSCQEGLQNRLDAGALQAEELPEMKERMHRELEVITKRGLADYFLVVADIAGAARSRGIPIGPGRGSAAGCLVAYLLGITEVNPLRYGLSFERFLSPDRPSLPDIDLDVCQRRRGEILEYVKENTARAGWRISAF